MQPLTPQRARSFGAVADTYDRARPAYPADALAWALAGARRPVHRVLDLGAGTGKLTGSLRAARPDLAVVAVEPDAAMLAVLLGRHPQVHGAVGAAEAIPLADGSVDAVLVGQAYHWFDPARALPEIARVLGPGGVLGLLWNLRDDAEPWVAELTRRMKADTDATRLLDPAADPPPGLAEHLVDLARHTTRHTQLLDADGLVALVASRSYAIAAPPDEREQLFAAVRGLAATHPALAGRSTFALPYLTETWRGTVPG
jgi:SAM-dependent methyltransferase